MIAMNTRNPVIANTTPLYRPRSKMPMHNPLYEEFDAASALRTASLAPAGRHRSSSNGPRRSRRFAVRLSDNKLCGGARTSSRFLRTERSEEHTSELQSRENLVCRL